MEKVIYDCIVVGAGTMGMATGAYLSQQNAHTLLIDAFDPPHPNGSHHGDTRMIRHAYGEGRQYVHLVKRAQELWEGLEKTSGYKIFEKTGVLGLGAKDSPFLNETIEAAHTYDLPLEVLTAQRIMDRWPGVTVPDHFIGCLELNSGLLYSENCIKAYKELALNHNAELVYNAPVLDINASSNYVEVSTKEKTFCGKKVIVTVGAWVGKLLNDLELPIQPIRKVFGWFDAPKNLYDVSHFPSFYVDEGTRMFYGFPTLNNTGLKIGRTDGGQPIAPNQHKQNFGSFEEDERELRECLQEYLPESNGSLLKGKTCLQTRSVDSHFIIDEHPEDQRIIIAAGFSGHGFKFGSVIGEALSEIILNGSTRHDLSLFSLKRFA